MPRRRLSTPPGADVVEGCKLTTVIIADSLDSADVLASVESLGGGVIPVGDNRFAMVWFPDGWEQLSNRKLVMTIHGNGGCAERNFEWWHGATRSHDYALFDYLDALVAR